MSSSSTGCWQEIRYLPENSGQSESTSNQAPHRQPPIHSETAAATPAIEKPEEKNLTGAPVDDTEQVPEGIRSDQHIPYARSSGEDSSDATQVTDSLTVSGPALSQTESSATNSQISHTLTADPQDPGAHQADLKPTRAAYAAWKLGSQWSMGAAIYAKGLPVERYQPFLERAESAARLLGVEFTPLPYKVINNDPVATIVAYLLDDQGSRLKEVLARQYGVHHAALFDLAIRSNLLLLIYSPQNLAKDKGLLSKEQFQIWVDRLTELVDNSQLSESLGKPLLDLLHSLAPYAEVKQAVFELHKQVAVKLKVGS